MDKRLVEYEENIKSALQGLKRRETDIVRVMEQGILALSRPNVIKVSFTHELTDHAVWIDEERISKTFANLMTNAVEAMPQGGELSISLTGSDEQVVITIQDTGMGISRDNMDNLFTPFFTTKPVGEGTGLGLPFAYGAVKLHGGKLSIESNADPEDGPTGTRVTIVLPRSRPDLKNVIIEKD
jgi:signal transduction histidine kinase